MKYTLVILSFLALSQGVAIETPCDEALDVSQKQLDIELDYFSRNFDMVHYNQAMLIYEAL